jgi:quercetin dioxygenase-like cupin family protein
MKMQIYSVSILSAVAASLVTYSYLALAQSSGFVERKGMSADLKVEQVVTGNLEELNGKYKMRVAAVTYEVGGFIGNHHHAGPGLRCVTTGTLTYVQEGETYLFGPGDCFYESGNVDHHANNFGDEPVNLFNFQILPVDWVGSSAITVTAVPE